jgi:hypothetical protein
LDEWLKEKGSELGDIIHVLLPFREKFPQVKKYSPPLFGFIPPFLVVYSQHLWKNNLIFTLILSLFHSLGVVRRGIFFLNKITKLEKQVKDLKDELKYEEIANNMLLEEKRKEKQLLEQQLAQQQTQITNYESQKQTTDRIIQQLKTELNELRTEKIQNAGLVQLLQIKEQRIQELTIQIERMTSALEQDLTNQVEFPPKGYF